MLATAQSLGSRQLQVVEDDFDARPTVFVIGARPLIYIHVIAPDHYASQSVLRSPFRWPCFPGHDASFGVLPDVHVNLINTTRLSWLRTGRLG